MKPPNVIVRLTKIMNNLLEHLKIYVLKIGQIFLKKKFYEEYSTKRPTFIKKYFWMIFKILHFLKLCPIFVGSVHDFGKSDDEKI